ncbi:MAG: serine/threonine protein kinase [Planctomycetota bacterium]|nr:serine/threonine protein kinase [Planctomycetota bacterium]
MSHSIIDESFLRRLPLRDGAYRLDYGAVSIDSKLEDALYGRSYLGYHAGLKQPVIVRVYPPETRQRPHEYERFMDDVRRVARVRHPSIAGIYEVGEHLGHPFFIMEYVSGVPLAERIKALPMPAAQAVNVLLPLAEGLCEIWRHGFVHRNVSPLYICLPSDGPAKLDVKTILPRMPIDTHSKRYLTPIMAPYWSPEEVSGESRIDGRADMWSFGAVFYHAVTGRIPFNGSSLEQVLHRILTGSPADPRSINGSLPQSLCDFLLRLLRREPSQRFATAEEFMGSMRAIHAQLISAVKDEKTAIIPASGFVGPRTAKPSAREKAETPELAEVAPVKEGDTIANCLIETEIGSGPTGKVFKARHKVLEIPVAVKVMPPGLGDREPIYLALFMREARVAARIRHPNVAALFEAGCEHGRHYFVMEYVPGGTVKERAALNGGRLSSAEVLAVMLGVAKGLAAAEKVNVVHRNIKPDNLMLGENGEVKIVDLGLAKRIAPKSGQVRESIMAEQITQHMGHNPVSGAPAYMAPELAMEPEKADIRADLYSLGVTAYYTLLGRLPFNAARAMDLLLKHQTEVPPAPVDVDARTPQALSDVIVRLLAKRPEARYASAAELAEVLEKLAPQLKT